MLSPNKVVKLFCLKATVLANKNGFYIQTFRIAMRSPVSVTVANLVLEM